MSEPLIEVRHVSKRYFQSEERFSLRHDLERLIRQTPAPLPFWALKDISFTVQPGERIAIIGRNGAGKTTLLRLLSMITAPTEGTITVSSPFVSLIGLGAGFDQERSGYENIFLIAAMYGLSPRELQPLLPEIIAFAEIDDFIYRPVKIYSSGMLARLGFSIAVHLLPQTIFLDEVFTVGDAAFQEKCVEKMKKLTSTNGTLVFVSHNPLAAQMLCQRGLWLHQGQLVMDDQIDRVLEAYEHADFDRGQ